MYSQSFLGSRSTAVPSLARASLPWAQTTGLRAGANGATPLAIFPSAQLEAQRETRRIPIMQKWRAGAIKTRDQVHKKAERTRRNQERCEYQRVKLHLKQGTLYEYIEGGTADEETKRKWFHQHFGHVQPKSRIAEEVTTGSSSSSSSSSEGASSPPPQQQSFVDLDAESVRVSQ